MLSKKFGEFGGQYVPETLINPLNELEKSFLEVIDDPTFLDELRYYLSEYVGRPTPLYFAKNLTEYYGGAKIYLKREDLNHTGAHKINNVLGQLLLAKRMGKKKVICETGAGQHGVATATGATLFNMECTVYMGEEDIKRQKLNVLRMELLGAKVVSVKSGTRTLKDATNEAIRSWVANADDTFYVIGSVLGPAPYPHIVRHFQKVIGEEAKEQILKKENKLPTAVIAAIGGGSNAMGIFNAFRGNSDVRLIGVEAAGLGINTPYNGAAIANGKPGVLHGNKTLLLQDKYGNILPAYSISAGLDYPGIGPEHAYMAQTKEAEYYSVTDTEALEAFELLSRKEGIIPAFESSHAIAYLAKIAPNLNKDDILIVCVSGRGDKDMHSYVNIKEGGFSYE